MIDIFPRLATNSEGGSATDPSFVGKFISENGNIYFLAMRDGPVDQSIKLPFIFREVDPDTQSIEGSFIKEMVNLEREIRLRIVPRMETIEFVFVTETVTESGEVIKKSTSFPVSKRLVR